MMRDLTRAGMSREMLRMLEGLPPPLLDRAMRTALADLLWQVDRADEIPGQVERWAAKPETLSNSTLGYLTLIHARDGRHEEADRAAGLIQDRRLKRTDRSAKAWAVLLGPIVAAGADRAPARQRIEAAHAALRENPGFAVAWDMLAEAYREVGEDELALRSYFEAARLAPLWASPVERAAKVLLRAGALREASEASEQAILRSSRDPDILLLRTMADSEDDASLGDSPRERVRAALLHNADLGSVPDVRRRALALLVMQDPHRPADDQVREFGQLVLEPEASTSRDTLLACADVASRTAELRPLAQRCLKHYESKFGATPVLARSWADLAARTEDDARGIDSPPEFGTEAGLQAFERCRARASDSGEPEWIAAKAVFLEGSRGDLHEARRAWLSLGDATIGSARLIRQALDSRAIWEKLETEEVLDFVKALTQQLKDLTGERALWYRLYEARLLVEAKGDAAKKQAGEILEGLLLDMPEFQDARPVLAEVYRELDGEDAALDELEKFSPPSGACPGSS